MTLTYLWKTYCTKLMSLTSSVTFKYSVAQYTQLCRFIAPLILKVVSSNQTMKSGTQSLSSHMCKNYSQSLSHPEHGAVSVYVVSTSHAAKCDQRWFYRHQTHQNFALENFFGDCVKAYSTVTVP
jgi:hypothetical protein